MVTKLLYYITIYDNIIIISYYHIWSITCSPILNGPRNGGSRAAPNSAHQLFTSALILRECGGNRFNC